MPRPDVVRVVATYNDTVKAVRARVLAFVAATWTGLESYRDPDIARFVAAVVPVVEGGQRRVAALTDAYLATVARTVLGTSKPVGVGPTNVSIENLRGVPATEVYTRPAITAWMALRDGKPLDHAVSEGLERAKDITASDLQLAKTHTIQRNLAADKRVAGYRRVLTGAHNCGLCIVASTQRYHKGDLLPIHPGCDCGVLPIYGNRDPGQIIDPDGLEGVHAAIQERFGVSDRGGRDIGLKDNFPDYSKVLVREHGELGPLLTVRGQKFTGPSLTPR